jgi:hypothetical protein
MKVMNIESREKKHLDELSHDEISLVQGGYGPPSFVVGGIAGGAAYIAEKAVSNESITKSGLITAVGVGAVAGFVGGPISIARSIWTIDVAIAGGTFTGVVNAMESVPKQDTSYWSDFSFVS